MQNGLPRNMDLNLGIIISQYDKEKLCTTHNIKQLGFSGLRAFGSRFNILVGGQERIPKTQPFHIVKRWHHCKMTRILYIILISISIWSCSQKFRSTELGEHFSEIEIKDLHRLTEFFQFQMCGTTNNSPACIDSLLPHLQEYGNCRRGLQGSFYSENIALRNFGITIMRVNID